MITNETALSLLYLFMHFFSLYVEPARTAARKIREGKGGKDGGGGENCLILFSTWDPSLTHVLLSSKSGSVANRTAKVHEPRELKDV